MSSSDSVSHVVVHEIGTWIIGGQLPEHAGPPRYLARAYVPGLWRKAMSAFLIAAITRAISQGGDEPSRCYREPCVEVHVIGVPEGGYGVFGRPAGESALPEGSARPRPVDPPRMTPARSSLSPSLRRQASLGTRSPDIRLRMGLNPRRTTGATAVSCCPGETSPYRRWPALRGPGEVSCTREYASSTDLPS